MSKKQKTARDMKQPLTSDFYSVNEALIEDVPLTPLIAEELAALAKCYRKKDPKNRTKLWKEYQQSQTVERSSSPEAEENPEESRVQEVQSLGPLARLIHYPLTPVRPDIEVNINKVFVDWIRALPWHDLEGANAFEFLPGIQRESFEVMRLELETRLDTVVNDFEWDKLFKSHGFVRLAVTIQHPTCPFPCFKSPRFYVVLAVDADLIFLNYFVHAS